MDIARKWMLFMRSTMDMNTKYPLSPEIVLANNTHFEGGREVHSPSVESRMCLWSKAGRGKIVVNGRRLPVLPFDYFVLPWRHSIRYKPDPRRPQLSNTRPPHSSSWPHYKAPSDSSSIVASSWMRRFSLCLPCCFANSRAVLPPVSFSS
jgi:hypothetical protein